MLELRPTCENCDKPLPPDSQEAMICTYECTFCKDCVDKVLQNVCPNCGGGFEKRPVRPNGQLEKHPPSSSKVLKPVKEETFGPLREKLKNTDPAQR